MTYNLYSDIPELKKISISGKLIKEIAERNNSELLVIKNNIYNHTIYNLSELNNEQHYTIFENEQIAGSGICYSKIFIFEK